MTDMLEKLNIELVGTHHSGIDDSRNIARIVQKLAKDGHIFDNSMAKNAR